MDGLHHLVQGCLRNDGLTDRHIGAFAAALETEGGLDLHPVVEIVGFDIEIVQAIAAKAGFEVKFVNTPWEGIFNALGQGDRDMVVSAVTITDERKQTMDFSNPYFDAQQLIAVKENRRSPSSPT